MASSVKPRLTEAILTTPAQKIIPSANVTLIVGPNNAGKSAVLDGIFQEITRDWRGSQANTSPVTEVRVETPTAEDFIAYVDQHATLREAGTHPPHNVTYRQPTYVFPSGPTIPIEYLHEAVQRTCHFGLLGQQVALLMSPEGRGSVLQSQQLVESMVMPDHSSTHPMHMLWDDRDLEKMISKYMQRAFGEPLTVDRLSRGMVHLHIGSIDIEEPRPGEKSAYLEELAKLPMLSAQGTGMQAFMGTLLTLATSPCSVALIDEPETFLHPPQARLLGEFAAEIAAGDGPQIIAATHSDDFVRGVIDASKQESDVTIIRLTRPSSTENHVAQIDPDDIRDIYRDPLLRFSRILDGIFYKGVVLCEGASDCTYYSAVLGHLETVEERGASDLLFTHCSGKDPLGKAYKALNAAAVPAAVITDIDVLSDEAKFSALFNIMGGDFSQIKSRYNVLSSVLRGRAVHPRRSDVRAGFNEVIQRETGEKMSKADLGALRTLIKSESGWSQIKKNGVGGMGRGDHVKALEDIVSASRELGLFILTVGELEGFHSNVTGAKPDWLRTVLERQLYTASDASALMRNVSNYISTRQ